MNPASQMIAQPKWQNASDTISFLPGPPTQHHIQQHRYSFHTTGLWPYMAKCGNKDSPKGGKIKHLTTVEVVTPLCKKITPDRSTDKCIICICLFSCLKRTCVMNHHNSDASKRPAPCSDRNTMYLCKHNRW